jgi:hypothetical protein
MIARGGQVYSAPMFNKVLAKPTLATFSTSFDDTVNSSAKTHSDNTFGIRMSKVNTTTSNVNDWGADFKAVSGATNWTATCLMQRRCLQRERMKSGLILRNAAAGIWTTIGWFCDTAPGGIGIAKWTGNGDSLGDAVAQALSYECPEYVWLRIEKNNSLSKFIYYYSLDGDYFFELWRYGISGGPNSNTPYGTAPDQIGFGVCPNCKDPVADGQDDQSHHGSFRQR